MYIKITDISKSYGTKENRNQVLSRVSMELEEGKICVIL